MRVTEIAKEIKLKGVWGELALKKDSQRQSFTKYFTITVVLMWSSALRETLNFCFSRVFC